MSSSDRLPIRGASLFVGRERVDVVLVVLRHRRGRYQRALPVSLRDELRRPHIGHPDLDWAQPLSAKPLPSPIGGTTVGSHTSMVCTHGSVPAGG